MLPWLETLRQNLNRRALDNKLPHALLFTGPRGYGKETLAREFAQGLLCQSPDDKGQACGSCASCHLLQAGTHPDFMQIAPEEVGKAIPVDRVRALGKFLALKGQYGNRQVVVIAPAEAMNRFAANSLLKTLEEPTAEALVILVSSRPSLLLPTIRSRCQQVTLPRPGREMALTWLKDQLGDNVDGETLLSLTDGAPLEAVSLHETGGLAMRHELAQAWSNVAEGKGDPLECAASWSEQGLAQAAQWLNSWIMDLIRLKSGAPPAAIVNCDLCQILPVLADRLELKQLFNTLEQITEYTRWGEGQLNPQLALEDIMISWGRASRRKNIKQRI